METVPTFSFEAIGVVHSDFADKFGTPRQPFATQSGAPSEPGKSAEQPPATGRIELARGRHFEDALRDIETWSHIWVLFVFDRNTTWNPTVRPPVGSSQKRGVFATRSPHRPNPIGMSVVKLLRVDGLTLHVSGLDILDQTPVLDIKPYVPVADVIDQASNGWLQPASEQKSMEVTFGALIETQLQWLRTVQGEDLRERIVQGVKYAGQPHAFRRIRKGARAGEFVLGMPGWRVDFCVTGQRIEVISLRSAHKPSHLANDPSLQLHRDFIAKFGS